MGHPTMQENDTAKLTPTCGGKDFDFRDGKNKAFASKRLVI